MRSDQKEVYKRRGKYNETPPNATTECSYCTDSIKHPARCVFALLFTPDAYSKRASFKF